MHQLISVIFSFPANECTAPYQPSISSDPALPPAEAYSPPTQTSYSTYTPPPQPSPEPSQPTYTTFSPVAQPYYPPSQNFSQPFQPVSQPDVNFQQPQYQPNTGHDGLAITMHEGSTNAGTAARMNIERENDNNNCCCCCCC
jgi:hypothetical protein